MLRIFLRPGVPTIPGFSLFSRNSLIFFVRKISNLTTKLVWSRREFLSGHPTMSILAIFMLILCPSVIHLNQEILLHYIFLVICKYITSFLHQIMFPITQPHPSLFDLHIFWIYYFCVWIFCHPRITVPLKDFPPSTRSKRLDARTLTPASGGSSSSTSAATASRRAVVRAQWTLHFPA